MNENHEAEQRDNLTNARLHRRSLLRAAGAGVAAAGAMSLAGGSNAQATPALNVQKPLPAGAPSERRGGRSRQLLHQRQSHRAQGQVQEPVPDDCGRQPLHPEGPLAITEESSDIDREFYDFYRTPRGEFTPPGASPRLTVRRPLTGEVKFMNFYPFDDIETISPRPLLFISGDQAHSKEFSQDAYERAAEPKELVWVPGCGPRRSLRPRHPDSLRQADQVLRPAPHRLTPAAITGRHRPTRPRVCGEHPSMLPALLGSVSVALGKDSVPALDSPL